MEIREIINILSKYTKTELVDLFEDIINTGDLTTNVVEKYITAIDMSSYEKSITDKLIESTPLLGEEKEYITATLNKRSKVRINTILNGNKKFDTWVLDYKLNKYFEMLWKEYPKKSGKDIGKKAFYKFIGEFKYGVLDNAMVQIRQRIIKYANQCQEQNKDLQYILMFSTYINQKRFNDRD